MQHPKAVIVALVLLSASLVPVARSSPQSPSPLGYYRQPALHDATIIFVAEGDLWKAPVAGGTATRLTSHPGEEGNPAISPDGGTIAFSAQYEGPTEVYTMPMSGGLPTRRTWSGDGAYPVGWTPDGRIIAATAALSGLPDSRLVVLDVSGSSPTAEARPIPLSQAADGCYEDEGKTLYFTRVPFQGSHTKRYQGGTAQKLWRFTEGDVEAVCLTEDWDGTSRRPMWWRGRIYFVSDRDGTMNVWSMTPDGGGLLQHTHHDGWDIGPSSLSEGRIVYPLGADLYILDIASGEDRKIPIALESDLDQMREHWVEKPIEYLTSAHVSPDGGRVALTARGRIFVAPRRQGRFTEVGRDEGVRYRDARFLPDGSGIIALSDKSGEVEFWKLPADGVGGSARLTSDGNVFRWNGLPSPDGRYLAHHDKNQRLFLLDLRTKENRKIDESKIDSFDDLSWSPDGQWLAYVARADNVFRKIRLYSVRMGTITDLTSDRYDSYEPVFSRDGLWLYFLSDRNLTSVVQSPWGSYEPQPFLDKTTRIYQIGLRAGERSPFAPDDELHPLKVDDGGEEEGTGKGDRRKDGDGKNRKSGKALPAVPDVRVDLPGIQERLIELPIRPGNYSNLMLSADALFWTSSRAGEQTRSLLGRKITNDDDAKVVALLRDVRDCEISQDGERILVRKGSALHIIDADPSPVEDLDKKKIDLSAWSLSVIPREEWRQMFDEAWRLERDYFYDPAMQGVDWKGMSEKYRPLVDRVRCRQDLADLLGQMVSELGALHTYVYGGDSRKGSDKIVPASLGAVLVPDERAGGYRVAHIYRNDPDEPSRAGPLSRAGVDVREGDVITHINGDSALSAPGVEVLLRQQAGKQVLLRVRPAGGSKARSVIVKPMTPREAADLRYHEWEYTRRLQVEESGEGKIGYVHLRAMGGADYTSWAKGYYPVFDREGLIIDVRHNGGGSIDSWILGQLVRKAWFYWSQRVGDQPSWNMQYAFRGHVVVLCDEFTASDGEAFAEGIKRLGIGKVIGTRTWGGEIWLSASNTLVDRGIATAAEFGVYGPEGSWLIEGHGVDPDIVVDNPPHATYAGQDAQLERAVAELQRMILEKPVEKPPIPRYPDRSFKEREK